MPFKLDLKSYHEPDSVREACDLLASEENAMALAGGTGIYIFSNKGMMSNIDTLVNLKRLNLSYVERGQESLNLGAMTRLSDLEGGSTGIQMIDEAVRSIPKEVRHMGTVGGQVFTAFPAFDLSVCLLSLNGSISITDGENTDTLHMSEAYSAMFGPEIPRGKIIEAVNAPSSYFNRTTYMKFSYTKHGFSDVSLALSLRVVDDKLEDMGIAVGGGALDSEPIKLMEVEKALRGREIDDDLTERGFDLISKSARIEFYSDHKATSDYRKRLAAVMFKRALAKLTGGETVHV